MAKKVKETQTIGIPYCQDPQGRQVLDPAAAIRAILSGKPSLETLATQERYPIDSVVTMRSDVTRDKYSILSWFENAFEAAEVKEVKILGTSYPVVGILANMKGIIDTWQELVPAVDAGGMRLSRHILLQSCGLNPVAPQTIVMVDSQSAIGAIGNVRNGQHAKMPQEQVVQLVLAGMDRYGNEAGYMNSEGVSRHEALKIWGLVTLVKFHGLTIAEAGSMKGDKPQQLLLSSTRMNGKAKAKATKEEVAENLQTWRETGGATVKAVPTRKALELAEGIAPVLVPLFQAVKAGNESALADVMAAYEAKAKAQA